MLVAALLFAGAGAAAAQTSPKTVLQGVYSPSQAKRGEAAYAANCSRCHRDSLEGNAEAPSLEGGRFMEAWRDDYMDGLFTYMKTRMPRRPGGEPGSLADATYLDILTYILEANGFPPGTKELTVDALASTLLVGKDGPKPLKTNAQVQVVGCLSQGSNDTWILNKSSEPVRARNPEQTTPEEIRASSAKPLGTAIFRLQNLNDLKPGFTPEPLKDHKVQVKGVLTRQSGRDRIYVNSLETVSPRCAE